MKDLFDDFDPLTALIKTDPMISGQLKKDKPTTSDALRCTETLHRYYQSFSEGSSIDPDEDEVDQYLYDCFSFQMRDSGMAANRKRNELTLRRIKQKGYWADSIPGLKKQYAKYSEKFTADDSNYVKAMSYFFLMAATDGLLCYAGTALPITEDEWFMAIEYGMLLADPTAFATDDLPSFALYLDGSIPYIWLALIVIHLATELERRGSTVPDLEKGHTLQAEIQKLQNDLAKADAAAEQQAKKAAVQAREEERRKWQKEILRVEYENDAALAAKDRYIRILERQVDIFSRPEAAFPEDFRAEPGPQIYEDSSDVILPEEGVLFLGGWPSILQLVRERHPRWMVIGPDGAERLRIGSSIKTVFFWHRYCSHKASISVFSQLADDAKVLFISNANVEKMEAEMRREFKRSQRG